MDVNSDNLPGSVSWQSLRRIPRAHCSFVLFMISEREKFKETNPGIHFLDVGKVFAEKWRNMSAEEKEPFEAKARADKKRYLEARQKQQSFAKMMESDNESVESETESE